jgi:hypothetical protein
MTTRIASLAILAGLVGAPATALADNTPVAAQVEKTVAPAPASQSETTNYAQREAQDKQAADFQGGNVVIVMSGAALVALILILLIL